MARRKPTTSTTAAEAVTEALRWHVLQTWIWSEHPEPSAETLENMRGHSTLGGKCLDALGVLIGRTDAEAIYDRAQRVAKREVGVSGDEPTSNPGA